MIRSVRIEGPFGDPPTWTVFFITEEHYIPITLTKQVLDDMITMLGKAAIGETWIKPVTG